MQSSPDNQMCFFGCPLDCDEKYDAIQERLHHIWTSGKSDDPLDEVLRHLRPEIPSENWKELGSVSVPSWLRPRPRPEDRSQITTESFIRFIDEDGCRSAADNVQAFVSEKVLPERPCLVGIDHSVSGGVFKALAAHHGRENLSLIILDSHTDAISMPSLSKAIEYDIDTNPESVHDPDDPFIYNRPDSYNASSFVYHLVEEKVVDPRNLYILGISDYPDRKAFKVKDSRIKSYLRSYTDLEKQGARLVTKKDCLKSPGKVKSLLKTINTSCAYVSVDMDLGANAALEGVRFRNWTGLNEKKMYKLVDAVAAIFQSGVHLAGMDVMEFDVRRAGEVTPAGEDPTYRIAAHVIKRIGFPHIP